VQNFELVLGFVFIAFPLHFVLDLDYVSLILSLSLSLSLSLIYLVCCFTLQFDAFRYVQLMSNLIGVLQIFFKVSEFYAFTK